MKPTKTFNLSKQTKRLMASILNKNDRDAFKANMIQAQLYSEIKPAKDKKDSK